LITAKNLSSTIMPPKKGNVNTKVLTAQEKKAAHQATQDAEAARRREQQTAQEWQQGANARLQTKQETAAQKADEAARKKREKEALLAAEEAELKAAGPIKKAPVSNKNSKKKGANDWSALEDALVSAADKKVKQKKQAALEKQQQAQSNKSENDKPIDPLLANTQTMIGMPSITMNDDDQALIGRKANVAQMEDGMAASGLDAALSSLNSAPVSNAALIKSAKALYNEFEDRMLPIVKEEHPGLRLSQYKEKIWALWKKSPENPYNQVAPS
jgi:hypothetical protein